MRVWKIKYEVTSRTELGTYRFNFFSSERAEFETIEEAIEYGRGKAEEQGVRFYGVDELKSQACLFCMIYLCISICVCVYLSMSKWIRERKRLDFNPQTQS